MFRPRLRVIVGAVSGRKQVLRVGAITPPSSLHDPSGIDFTSAMVFSHVYETPFARDHVSGDRVPLLFARPLRRRSDTTWEATPRSGLRLSDGSDLTARDLATALHAALEAEGMSFDVDREHIVISAPNVCDVESRLTRRGCALGFRRGDRVLGTGPYLVAEASESLIVLEANPHTPHPPNISRVEIHCFPTPRGGKDALIEALNAGEIDLTVDLSRADVERVTGMRKVFRPGASTCILAFNTEGALSDVTHRAAIAKLIDLHALSEACYQNSVAYLARGVLPPLLGRTRPGHTFSPEDGKAALASARFDAPLRLLRVWGPRSYNPEPARTAELIAQQLVSAGIPVTHITTSSPQEYQDFLDRGAYDLVLGGWIADTAEPLDFYEALIASDMIPSATNTNPNRCNNARWADPQADALLDNLRQTGDTSLYRDIEAYIAEACPFIPLMYGPSIAVHGWHIQGFSWGQRTHPSFCELEIARSL